MRMGVSGGSQSPAVKKQIDEAVKIAVKKQIDEAVKIAVEKALEDEKVKDVIPEEIIKPEGTIKRLINIFRK